jgi:acetyltransferase-like isoleucine patch superfamily enzyme
LGSAVHVGMQCKIGANTTILHNSVVADKVKIGKQVLIARPGCYDKSVNDKIFFLQKSELDIAVISCYK